MSGLILLDEMSHPALRTVIGRLLAEADAVDFALARIRLANLDLTDREIRGPEHCRVLLRHLDASMLLDTGGAQQADVARLARWARSGRLEVRSAGIGSWTPDFSVYHGATGRCMLGAHYFGSPQLTVGPALTVVTDSPDVRAVLNRRFDGLWERSHDVLPAITRVLERVGTSSAP